MEKLWTGRTSGITDSAADDFNSSIRVDSRMYAEDIAGSAAHAAMLGARGIISQADADSIIDGLNGILADIKSDALAIDMSSEDIHMFIEAELTRRIGDAGKRLHTARSRNDQVALDTRMYLKNAADALTASVKRLITALADQAEQHCGTIMPGYTHLQRAQPVSFGHQLMAYAMMLLRDADRLGDCKRRMNVSPLGCCALAGTTYPIDRDMTAAALGFDSAAANSIDGVSDRDFCLELASACSIIMMHLSRFCEELILWSSWEFSFIALDDAYTTGSSIMPQKKNSDMAELVRGKTGRVYGDLIALLTLMKGIPLAYNKDMQEDKEAIFDAADTVRACLDICASMTATMHVKADNMLRAAQTGFINATDLADYLTAKGMPFRTAYKAVGGIVKQCIDLGTVLEALPLGEYKKISELFSEDVYAAIDLKACLERRRSKGGVAPESVKAQIALVRDAVK